MNNQEKSMRIINHKTMRRRIGYIALVMPFAVWLFSKPELLSQDLILTSISISYWTTTDDIFIGCLFAVGFFLAAYNGTGSCKRDSEFWLSKIAFVSAIGLALFPTCGFDDPARPLECVLEGAPSWIMSISFNHPNWLHYTFTISLFICLFCLLVIFSFRASRKGALGDTKEHKGASRRSWEYLLYGLGMFPGMLVLLFILDTPDKVFYVEFFGLFLFGIGWLRAGWYGDVAKDKLPKDAVELDTVEIKDPRQFYYDTKIDVEAGVKYFFKAEGCWRDLIINCGPDGWGPAWKFVTAKNRIQGVPFFKLCGAIGEIEDHNFIIGESRSWVAPDSMPENNRLYFFANDWPTKKAYQNNKTVKTKQGGPLKVTIYKVN